MPGIAFIVALSVVALSYWNTVPKDVQITFSLNNLRSLLILQLLTKVFSGLLFRISTCPHQNPMQIYAVSLISFPP